MDGRTKVRTWGIDDINGVLLLLPGLGHCGDPVAERRRALDSDAFLPLKFHAVHLGSHIVAPSHLRFSGMTGVS